ncbi:Tn916, FtsK/SpoIIIE family protein [Streptococcus oralis Uo5]|uniref:Tn916, FtsK/SpoIIIE family protein n=1 Tax=Streptococcus oralis (strain Uo5) TaxID=927666 RepID=F2QFU5_STROU|nr:Tn916, FtsK/SpoIIIE family protein [Streptococcus oralis Uo5]
MKQRGKRIRPSGKDLVFHFTIASLLPVFLLVVGLFHVKTIQRILTYHKQIRLTFPI